MKDALDKVKDALDDAGWIDHGDWWVTDLVNPDLVRIFNQINGYDKVWN
jgi:hypothetical protein